MSGLPGAYLYLPNRFLPAVGLPTLIGWYGFLLLFYFRKQLHLTVRRAGILLLVVANIYIFSGVIGLMRRPAEFELTCLDVGHGAAIYIRTGDGRDFLFDCGRMLNGSVTDYVVAPFLWQHRVTSLDAIILSHPDSDHINGVITLVDKVHTEVVMVSELFEQFPAGQTFLNALKERGVPVRKLQCGDLIHEGDDVKIEVAAPLAAEAFGKRLSENDTSLVLRICAYGKKFLLTGDIQEVGTELLLQSGQKMETDVVQIPHHGGKNILAPLLMERTRPKYAFVNALYYPSGLDPYRTGKVDVCSTRECGAITFRIRNGEVHLKQFLLDF